MKKLLLTGLVSTMITSCNTTINSNNISSSSSKVISSSQVQYKNALEEFNANTSLDFDFLDYKENCDLSDFYYAQYESKKDEVYFSKKYTYPYFEGVYLYHRVTETELCYYTFGSVSGYESDVLKYIAFSDTSIEFFGLTLSSSSNEVYDTFIAYGYQGRTSIGPTGVSYTFKKENITVMYFEERLNEYGVAIKIPYIIIEKNYD